MTWLLSAEDGLQAQPAISSFVEEVKEQFHTHEVNHPLIFKAFRVELGEIRRAGHTVLFATGDKAPDVVERCD